MTMEATTFADTDIKMPVLFIGHGSPMNALEENEFTRSWAEISKNLPRPKAILCISAHWETRGSQVTAMEHPKTIHDFGGFPPELFASEYPAPGSLELANLVQKTVQSTQITLDQSWGLDHGTWSVLIRMYPDADIPVVQLSLDRFQKPAYHFALGKELQSLRSKGILILGSGNIVHNLRLASFRNGGQNGGYEWASEIDETIKRLILVGDYAPIIDYSSLGDSARLAIPTNEHYLPLLYVLGAGDKPQKVQFFTEQLMAGSLSMRSVWLD